MVLANWVPRDTHRGKYPTGGILAGGDYSNPIRPIFPALSTLSILQDRDLPNLRTEWEMARSIWTPNVTPFGVTYNWDSGHPGSIIILSFLPYPTYPLT